MCTSKPWVLPAVAVLAGLTGGCDDPPAPPMPAPATAGSAATGATSSSATAPKPPPPRTLEAPSTEAIAALDVKAACRTICETQVRCSVSADVADDDAKLTERQKGCVDSCKRTAPPKEVEEQYLERARRCLASRDCNAFNACAFATTPK